MNNQIKKRNLTEIAYDTIKQRILENKIKPGAMLSEKSIAQELNMSRTPVREALKMLKSEDLLEIKDGVGTYVKSISSQDIEDAYEIRKSLEILAARTSIYRFTDEDIETLEQQFCNIKQRFSKGLSISVEKYAKADWLLHDMIVKKSNNKYVERVTNEISAILRRYQFMSVKAFSHVGNSTNEHIAIVDCIKRKDLDGLIAMLEHHIQY